MEQPQSSGGGSGRANKAAEFQRPGGFALQHSESGSRDGDVKSKAGATSR